MGLEFLREHGGRRVREYPEQPELDGPDEEPEGDGTGDMSGSPSGLIVQPLTGTRPPAGSWTVATSATRSPGFKTPRDTPSP
jgi:hypothetical protein